MANRHYEDMEQETDPTTPQDTSSQDAEIAEETGAETNFDQNQDTESEADASAENDSGSDQAGTSGAHFETPPPPPPPSYTTAPEPQKYGRLYRTNGPISGVSGGIADYFGIDPVIVRLAMVAGTIIGGPTLPIAYIAAWIIIPEANPAPVAPIMTAQPTPPPPPQHPDAPAPAYPPVPTAAP